MKDIIGEEHVDFVREINQTAAADMKLGLQLLHMPLPPAVWHINMTSGAIPPSAAVALSDPTAGNIPPLLHWIHLE